MKKTPQPIPKRLLRVKEAAAYLGISARKLRSLVQSGQMPFVQFEAYGPWWIDLHDLETFIEAAKQRVS